MHPKAQAFGVTLDVVANILMIHSVEGILSSVS